MKDIPVKTVAYFIWKNPYMVAGSDNFINELLKPFKISMIIRTISQVEIEKYSRGNPDLILLSSEPFPLKKRMATKSVIYG
jgi:ABC-type Fe3+-hydroxamate transport system substrate-binding protein